MGNSGILSESGIIITPVLIIILVLGAIGLFVIKAFKNIYSKKNPKKFNDHLESFSRDDDLQPNAEMVTPVHFELVTRELTYGEHTPEIVSKSPAGKEGNRKIKFYVRNDPSPSFAVEGRSENSAVDGIVPLMMSAYDQGNQKKFIIHGSKTPQSIPSRLRITIVAFTESVLSISLQILVLNKLNLIK